ncbi:MAG: response regulator [Gammaproteobacteria bacterium]|nr:response regulator [Gammaproteobacteria bacterium]
MKSLMIVEDEQIVALSLKIELEELGYFVVGIAATEVEAVSLFKQCNPNLVLMDINLESGGSGINAAKQINAIRQVPIIYVTAYAGDEVVKQANEANPIGYIVKPYNLCPVLK